MVVPVEARIRRLALETMLRLRSCAAVARELNYLKELTRRGGEWSDVQVAGILSCTAAIGKYPLGAKAGELEGEVLPCEPLVAEAVWQQVQAILRGRGKRKAVPAAKEAPLFAGMLWCGYGKRLHFHPDSGRGDCRECGVRVSHAEMEGVLAEDFFVVVSSIPQLIGALCQLSEFRSLACEFADLQHLLDSARAKQAQAERLLGERSITARRFDEIHTPLEREIRATEGQLAKLKATMAGQSPPPPGISPAEWQRQWAT